MSDWDRERAWQLCMELEQCMREAGVVTTAHYGRGQDVLARALAERDAYADELVAVRLTADATRDRLTAERDAARAELERVRATLKAVVNLWPATGRLGVDEVVDHPEAGKWLLNRENYSGMHTRLFGTKLAAILALAGLAPPEGAELTLAERNAVVAGVAGAMAEGAKEGSDG